MRPSRALLLLVLATVLAGPGPVRAAPPRPAAAVWPRLPPRPSTPVRREIAVKSTGRETGVCRVVLDLAPQVLSVDVPGYLSADDEDDSVLLPSVTGPAFRRAFVTAAGLAAKARPFEDGLLAAVELAADQAIGSAPGRVAFLRTLYGLLARPGADPARARAAALVAAALELGGTPATKLPADPVAIRAIKEAFLRRPEVSRPLSFYTWSPSLSGIFQRDRLLGEPVDPAAAAALSRALGAAPAAGRAYRALLELNAAVFNPARWPDLRRPPRPGDGVVRRSLVPPARSPEVALVERMYGASPVPDGFDLASEVVERVRKGRLSLAPVAGSGWYDHLLHALEPLLLPDRVPEAAYRRARAGYREYLEDLFKALFAQARELMGKGVGLGYAGYGAGGSLPEWRLELTPTVELEPSPTHYLRRALAYRFIRQALTRTLGAAALGRLRGLRPGGAVTTPLDRELREMESLFHGAYLAAAADLGMPAAPQADLGLPGGTAVALAHFRRWASGQASDPDLGRDVRMMVPVFHDVQRGKTKVWVLMGVRKERMEIDFQTRPRVVKVLDPVGGEIPLDQVQLEWESVSRDVPSLQVAEVYVTQVQGREAFRRHCDRWKTRKAILANLR